jgi:hypothetical protein
MKDLGKLHHFLGVTVEPGQAGLFLHQVFSFTSVSMPLISWRLPG